MISPPHQKIAVGLQLENTSIRYCATKNEGQPRCPEFYQRTVRGFLFNNASERNKGVFGDFCVSRQHGFVIDLTP